MCSRYSEAVARLRGVYSPGEARAVARALLEDAFGVDMASVYSGKVRNFSAAEDARFRSMLRRLEAGEPVQYVTGVAPFGPLTLEVGPGVLVPRPETLELARWAAEGLGRGARAADLGTGSGCIALYLAAEAGARVTAVDISPDALAVARRNAARLGLDVEFAEADILGAGLPARGEFSLVVSNPPYVCESEKAAMERNVLDYEPSVALFVSDADPLLYYRAVARHAARMLASGGAVLVEANSRFARDTAELFAAAGFGGVELRDDMEGRPRMVKAVKI